MDEELAARLEWLRENSPSDYRKALILLNKLYNFIAENGITVDEIKEKLKKGAC